MMEQLVSVVIPVYNCEEYIGETLKSVLSQTYKNIEAVLVDDGSRDNSAEIIKDMQREYGDRIRYIYQENAGVSVARNTGIWEAAGEYIAFLDSDDLWLGTKIEKQMKRMQESGMKACYCGYTNWYDASDIKKDVKWNFLEGKVLEDYLKENVWAQTGTWIVKKDVILENNLEFTPKCSWAEDAEFFIKIVSLVEVCCVPEYLTLYRMRENNSLTQQALKDINLKGIESWERLRDWMAASREKVIGGDPDRAVMLINRFRIPKLIIKKLYDHVKSQDKRDRVKEIYLGNNEAIRALKFVLNKEGAKIMIKKFLLGYYLK